MENVEYATVTKNFMEELGLSDGSLSFGFEKPLFCPICAMPNDGINTKERLMIVKKGDSFYTAIITYQCTRCLDKYQLIYEIDRSKKKAAFSAFYPKIKPSFQDDILLKISPRFIDMYNQALLCEKSNHIELSAIGYRAALEILIKDYAIRELGEVEEAVSSKSIYEVIGTYLDKEAVKSADVVRILGNDYAHYERKYPQYEFDILKEYLGIFLGQVRAKYKISHPPVERKQDV